jgi:hypothetical protein
MMQGKGGFVRILIVSALLIATASCAAPSGRLTLSNFNFDGAHVQTVVTASPNCTPGEGTATGDFVLPLNGTRVVEGAPGADVCWRRAIEPETAPGAARLAPTWTEWNRAFLSSGRSIDSQL